MRLLDARTLELQTFYGDEIPSYAILSHTWLRDEDEVTHAQIQDLENCRHMFGYQKIEYTCRQALLDGLKYVWIDTCCIDKTNSTELSEAISSMFEWYSESFVCYVYVMDVESEEMTESFACSRWWTRAWTLQELLAPTDVQFYNVLWQRMGSKIASISIITSVTGIDEETVRTPSRMFDRSIAQRLSWAAGREAKRIEDRAYSLIGLLGVKGMTMQYGEGSGAFMRLQELILQDNNDQTLFAWNFIPKTIPEMYDEIGKHEILASSALVGTASERLDNREDRMSESDQNDQEPKFHLDEEFLSLSPNGLFAMDPDYFRHSNRVVFQEIHGIGSDLVKLSGAWRMNMPIVHMKERHRTYQIGLLPSSYADRPYHLLAILLYSWSGGSRYYRIGLGGQTFTFLVDVNLVKDAYVERLWVEGSKGLYLPSQPMTDRNVKDYRSIKVRIEPNQDDWCFTIATPKEAIWSSSDMVLRYVTNRPKTHLFGGTDNGDRFLLSFKYCTDAQINFVLELPNLPVVQSPAGGELDRSRIVVFVGDERDEDWAEHLKQMWDEVGNAESSTPGWTLQASVTTRRVFNQLISTLDITNTKSLADYNNYIGELDLSQGKDLSNYTRSREELFRMSNAPHPCPKGGANMPVFLERPWRMLHNTKENE